MLYLVSDQIYSVYQLLRKFFLSDLKGHLLDNLKLLICQGDKLLIIRNSKQLAVTEVVSEIRYVEKYPDFGKLTSSNSIFYANISPVFWRFCINYIPC